MVCIKRERKREREKSKYTPRIITSFIFILRVLCKRCVCASDSIFFHPFPWILFIHSSFLWPNIVFVCSFSLILLKRIRNKKNNIYIYNIRKQAKRHCRRRHHHTSMQCRMYKNNLAKNPIDFVFVYILKGKKCIQKQQHILCLQNVCWTPSKKKCYNNCRTTAKCCSIMIKSLWIVKEMQTHPFIYEMYNRRKSTKKSMGWERTQKKAENERKKKLKRNEKAPHYCFLTHAKRFVPICSVSVWQQERDSVK